MANGSEIQVGDYVIHLTRAEEGLWHVLEITDRALVMENPKGERRLINIAFAHHLVRQDPERFEVHAAFERADLLRLAGTDPAALVTRLARQYGTISVRDIRDRLEPLFASKEAFRKWWAARVTKAALLVAPHLEFIPPSTYRYLENPRAVAASAPLEDLEEAAPPASPADGVHWPDLNDIVENGDGSGAVANRIKWRHASGLLRAIQAGRAADWERDAVQSFLTTVLLEDRLSSAERLRAATELYQMGWVDEEEVRSLGLEFWAPPAEEAAVLPPESPPRAPRPPAEAPISSRAAPPRPAKRRPAGRRLLRALRRPRRPLILQAR